MAALADAKATQSEDELESKGAAYRADRLFTYLWERGYGTTDYRPGGGLFCPLLRWLDGKVARLIGYADARPNYHRLQELPERLREHAERLQARAEAEFERLKQLDMEGRRNDGIPAIEERLAATEAALVQVQESMTALAGRNQEALAELGRSRRAPILTTARRWSCCVRSRERPAAGAEERGIGYALTGGRRHRGAPTSAHHRA